MYRPGAGDLAVLHDSVGPVGIAGVRSDLPLCADDARARMRLLHDGARLGTMTVVRVVLRGSEAVPLDSPRE
jgi:hypothetical protein